jgi:multiple sugar transport system substrate-binding protein
VRRLLGGAATALLLACAPGKASEEVVFWQFWPLEVITPIVQRFESEHPGTKVRVEQLTWDGGKDKITAAVAAGDPPDLCELGSTYMPRFLDSGSLTDWSAGVADLRDSLRGWDLCRVGDTIYGLPWQLGTRALFYNKTLLARAGLDSTRPPETWSELRHAAERVHALGAGVHGYGVSANDRQKLFKKFMPFAWGNGGEILSPDLDSSRFDSPANREALEFYLGLRKAGMLGMQADLDKEFKEGRLGLQISGAWLCKQIPAEVPALRYGVALVPRPGPDRGVHASFAGGEVLVSFNSSKRKEPALRLARFLVRPDNALALARAAMSVQPAAVGADTAAFFREHAGLGTMIRQFQTARATPNHPEWDAMEAAIEDEIEQALYDRKSAAQAIQDAHLRIAALIGKR